MPERIARETAFDSNDAPDGPSAILESRDGVIDDGPRAPHPLADRRAAYASALAKEGDPEAAADLMRQALDLAPQWVAGWMTLGGYLESAGAANEAADVYRTALGLDAADGHGAALKLAALGLGPLPATAPPAFVRGLFDQYAGRFEASLVGGLGYAAPDGLMAALSEVTGRERRYAHALDLGCGTGLMGERLRGVCDTLSGIDLSPAMVDKARRKGLYDRLCVGDILDAEPGDPAPDLVVAADVLIYVGDLRAVLARISSLMPAGGLFAFTVEAHESAEPYVVGPSLRFAHSRAGIGDLAKANGLAVRHEASLVLRQDRGMPVSGLAFVLEKAAAAARE